MRITDLRAEILDSRDLIEYAGSLDEEDEEDAVELAAINELADEGIEDWEYGAQLIREDYFQTYAQELAEDIGAISNDHDYGWPLSHIDWEAAADALKVDYTEVEFLGNTYYVH